PLGSGVYYCKEISTVREVKIDLREQGHGPIPACPDGFTHRSSAVVYSSRRTCFAGPPVAPHVVECSRRGAFQEASGPCFRTLQGTSHESTISGSCIPSHSAASGQGTNSGAAVNWSCAPLPQLCFSLLPQRPPMWTPSGWMGSRVVAET